MFDSLLARNYLAAEGKSLELTGAGRAFISGFGIDLEPLAKSRRPLCKSCLDWSARRSHLAGSLGTAFLKRFYELNWAKRREGSRIIKFSAKGEKDFLAQFTV